MKKKKKSILVILAWLLLLCNIIIIPVNAEDNNGKKIVRVACGMNDVLYLDDVGDPAGLAMPYIKQLAWNAGWTLEYVEGSYSESLERLYNGEIDLMLPVGADEDPDGKLLYSEFDCGIQQIGLFARDDADIYYNDFENFDGKKIGLSLGGNSLILDKYAEENGFSYQKITDYNSVQDKVDALANGDVDMIAFSTLNSVPGGKLVALLDQLPGYICTSKENPELYEELNNAITEALIHTPDIVSQCAADMLKGTAVTSFTRAEHEKIVNSDEIVVGLYSDFMPLAGVDKNGNCIGIYVDALNEIGKISGLRFRTVPVEDSNKLYSYIDDGTVDLVMSVYDLRFHVENADNYLISNGIGDYTTVAVSKPEYQFEDDDSTSFALIKPRSYLADYINANFPGATITYYDTRKECFEAVESGNADATFANTWEFNYESKNPRFHNLMEWESIRIDSSFAIGASKDTDLEILNVIEKTISMIPEGTIEKITAENLNRDYADYTLSDRIYMMKDKLIIGTIAVLLLTAIILFYLYEMHKRSKEYSRLIGYICTVCDSVSELNLKTKKVKKYVMHNGLVKEEYMENHIEKMFFVDPADQQMVSDMFSRDKIKEIIENGDTVSFECRMKWKEEDEYRWNTCVIKGIPITKAKPYNIMMLIRDINDMRVEEEKQKRALEDAFEHAKQASLSKGQFLSRMSHEIRTPLNAVIGYMSMGKDAVGNQDKMLHCIDKSSIAAKHLLNIINDVLDISSIESGKMKIAVTDFDLKGLISEITTVFYQQAKEKGIQFAVNIKDVTQEWVMGDSLRVKQILMNLLSNAMKFTPENGTITMNVEQLQELENRVFISFEVKDTGIGMSEEYLNRLFQPFEQESAVTAQKFGGSGLGLSITKNLVDMMGGTIKVQSKQKEGSSFKVTLYFEKSDKNVEAIAKTSDYSHVRVLVVDDIADEGTYIKKTLKQCNVKSDTVTSGADAFKQLKRRRGTEYAYSMCILDFSMPGLNGIDTAREIRKEFGNELPILIATAYDTVEIESEAKKAGVNKVISKPLFPSMMFDLLVSNFGKYDPDRHEDTKPVDVSGLNILLAEDNEMNMEIAVDVLQKSGITVIQAENGQEAVSTFTEAEPGTIDMILMDIQMPIMNGYEATHAIRNSNHPEAKTIPIIAMTANAFAEDVTEALANGMNDHISKPIDKVKLINVIDKFHSNSEKIEKE